MKKILLLILLSLFAITSYSQSQLNQGYIVNSNQLADRRSSTWNSTDGTKPFSSIEAAHNSVPAPYRSEGQQFYINTMLGPKWFFYKGGVNLENIVPISSMSINNGTLLYEDSLKTISSEWSNIGANPWTVVSNGIKNNGTGFANRITLNRQYNLNPRKFRTKVNISTNSRAMIHTTEIETNTGNSSTIFELDQSSGNIRIYEPFNSITATLPDVEVETPMTLVAGRDYIVQIERTRHANILTVTDGLTGETKTIADSAKGSGRQYDVYSFTVYSGGDVTIKYVNVTTKLKQFLHAIVFGDSITDAVYNPLGPDDGYAQLFRNAIDSIYETSNNIGISGRGGGGYAGVMRRIETEAAILKPKYCIVTIGTNGGVTQQQLIDMINRIRALGMIPIINDVPREGNGDDVLTNSTIESTRVLMGVRGAFFNIATSTNFVVASGQNQSIYNSDGGLYVHPNEIGMYYMYLRMIIDLADLSE